MVRHTIRIAVWLLGVGWAPHLAAAAVCPDEMALAQAASPPVCVDRYEASRADATATWVGEDTTSPPRSVPGVVPWFQVTWTQAQQACASAGKRLCTLAELQAACAGPQGLKFPYGATYAPEACNGHLGSGHVVPTGSMPACVSADGIHDLSGNLQEWTATEAPSGGRCVFGGDYYTGQLSDLDNVEQESCAPEGIYCYAFPDPDQTAKTNLGFRCCLDPPGEPEPIVVDAVTSDALGPDAVQSDAQDADDASETASGDVAEPGAADGAPGDDGAQPDGATDTGGTDAPAADGDAADAADGGAAARPGPAPSPSAPVDFDALAAYGRVGQADPAGPTPAPAPGGGGCTCPLPTGGPLWTLLVAAAVTRRRRSR